ncbi:MAG: hypothetical protein QME78_09945 [Thermodesulfobacteriota bacterium]|nr:hypothetical protein [Thermodesulfobacteriota bacterium]
MNKFAKLGGIEKKLEEILRRKVNKVGTFVQKMHKRMRKKGTTFEKTQSTLCTNVPLSTSLSKTSGRFSFEGKGGWNEVDSSSIKKFSSKEAEHGCACDR